MQSGTNINNLNVLTFIKDIYLSLKHIDQCFNTFKTDIDSRITKLEDNQHVILEKLVSIEQIINKILEKGQESNRIDKNLEMELFDKMYNLDKTASMNTKLDLKTKELTIANILENNYTLLDIENSLTNSSVNKISNDITHSTASYSVSNIDNSLYKPLDLTDNMLYSNLEDVKNMNKNNDNTKQKKERLDKLLF